MLVILMISSCATGHIEKSKKLHGFYIENDYVSPGNTFKIKLDKNSLANDVVVVLVGRCGRRHKKVCIHADIIADCRCV